MPARDEHRRWNVTRLELQAWRNFSRQTEIHLGRPKAARQNEATFSDGTLRRLGLLWSLAEQGGPLLLEEPEPSLHDALVSRVAPIMARMHRKTGRQVLVTTHSTTLLQDRGI